MGANKFGEMNKKLMISLGVLTVVAIIGGFFVYKKYSKDKFVNMMRFFNANAGMPGAFNLPGGGTYVPPMYNPYAGGYGIQANKNVK